jgi:hypothetical protein
MEEKTCDKKSTLCNWDYILKCLPIHLDKLVNLQERNLGEYLMEGTLQSLENFALVPALRFTMSHDLLMFAADLLGGLYWLCCSCS